MSPSDKAGTWESHFKEEKGCPKRKKSNKDSGFGMRKQTSHGLPTSRGDERQGLGGRGLGLRRTCSSLPPLWERRLSLPASDESSSSAHLDPLLFRSIPLLYSSMKE